MLRYLLEKEFKQFKRNPFLPRLVIMFPLMVLLIFPLVANFEVKNINLSVIDHDKSSFSSDLIQKIKSSGFGPVWCGPLIQQIRPDSIEQASSYRQPGPSNLYEYQARSNGRGSWMGQSVPFTTSKHT